MTRRASGSVVSPLERPKALSTTTIFLVRHASHDRLGRELCGRAPGVGLSQTGFEEGSRLSSRLAGANLSGLYSSPLQRTLETAGAIATTTGLDVHAAPDLIEIDFGQWTAMSFEQLARDPGWSAWNSRRSLQRPPGGETMGEAQVRAVRGVETLCESHPEQVVAAVSHSDIIKAVLAHYLGLSLDFLHRFEVDPASVSTLVVGDWGAKVLRINEGGRP